MQCDQATKHYVNVSCVVMCHVSCNYTIHCAIHAIETHEHPVPSCVPHTHATCKSSITANVTAAPRRLRYPPPKKRHFRYDVDGFIIPMTLIIEMQCTNLEVSVILTRPLLAKGISHETQLNVSFSAQQAYHLQCCLLGARNGLRFPAPSRQQCMTCLLSRERNTKLCLTWNSLIKQSSWP